jgi:hypothetical protein
MEIGTYVARDNLVKAAARGAGSDTLQNLERVNFEGGFGISFTVGEEKFIAIVEYDEEG